MKIAQTRYAKSANSNYLYYTENDFHVTYALCLKFMVTKANCTLLKCPFQAFHTSKARYGVNTSNLWSFPSNVRRVYDLYSNKLAT